MDQPLANAQGDIGLAHALDDAFLGNKMVLDEIAQTRGDTVLAVRDDGGVPQRDAERIAEQRDDGEPVGNRADHRGLGECFHVAPGRMLAVARTGNREQHAGDEQQADGDALHHAQAAAAVGVFGDVALLDDVCCFFHCYLKVSSWSVNR